MSPSLAAWLDSCGLGRYADAFDREGIDADVLADLSDEDLAGLGVTLGDRKRLARALAEVEHSPAETVSVIQDSDAWHRRPGERKPVTMLFADITGSTALTEQLDPEDAHELLYGLVEKLCGAVERNRGTVCRFMGDGVMAMFGAPVSFEDHPEWACRAALEMLAVVTDYRDGQRGERAGALQLRVGVHTGEVVVLRVGEGEAAGWDASGPTVPLAARMEQSAAPGTVQVTASTYALVADRFDAMTLAPVRVKGFSDPVPAVRLLAEHAGGRQPAAGPFVGRRAELAQLDAVLEAAQLDGYGRTVYLRGDPGIGKSRVLARLSEKARGLGFQVHRTLVLDFGAGKGRDPVRLLVRDLLGLASDVCQSGRRDAARRAVEAGLADPQREAHLCDLLDAPLPVAMRAEYEALDATTRARERAEVLVRLVAALSAVAPRLIVVEDLHWAPAPLRHYLRALAHQVASCPAVLAVSTRIEGDPLQSGWQAELDGLPVTVLTLGPLSPREAHELALDVGLGAGEAVDVCVARSGCNPLFLEHLLGALRDGGGSALPTSIATSVAARVDSLEPEDKRAVQAAAVLGQRFDAGALRALIDDAGYDCTRLLARGLVKPDGDAFLFAHALVQEAVLGMLLRTDRAALHSRAAQWFEPRDPVLFARHLDQAGDPRAAEAYLQAAHAEAAAMRFVFARDFAMRGLELAADGALRAALHSMLGRLLVGIGDMRAAAQAYRKAAEAAVAPPERCAAWTGVAHALRNCGAYAEGLIALDAAEVEAREHGLVRELAVIHHHRGNILFLQVDGAGCEREQRRALVLAEQCDAPEEQALALSGLARAHFVRGRVLSGADCARRCVELARAHGLDGIVYGHLHMVGIGLYQEMRLHEAASLAVEAAEHASRVGMPRQGVVSNFFAAKILADMNRHRDAEHFARRSLELAERVGERRYVPAARSVIARLVARTGEVERAEEMLREVREQLDDLDLPFSGPLVFGALAQVAQDADLRAQAIASGRALRERPCFVQFLLDFYRYTLLSVVERREWELATVLADELEATIPDEPMPLTTWHVQWARAAAASARGETGAAAALGDLCRQADAAGLKAVPAMP